MKRPVTGAVVGNQSSEPSTTEATHSRIPSVLQAAMLEGQPTKALETKHLDMELQDLVCIMLVFVLLWFSIFSLCPPVLFFWNENGYSVPLYGGSM